MKESDDYLVSQVVLNGSHAAYSELIRRHQAAVRSSLNFLTRDSSLTDDLAQDTFIRAYDRISQYKQGRSFMAWLGGIAYNEFLKTMRKQGNTAKKLEMYADSMMEKEEATGCGINSSLDLGRALATLSVNERTALLLCFGLGMSHSEVSTAMDEPLGTVKSWVQRAKLRIRGTLENYHDGSGDE